jgi:hypothetical protein
VTVTESESKSDSVSATATVTAIPRFPSVSGMPHRSKSPAHSAADKVAGTLLEGTRMTSIRSICAVLAVLFVAALPQLAAAQGASGSGQASGGAEIEMGAIHPSPVETNAGRSTHRVDDSSDPRLAIQARIDALNMLGFSVPGGMALGAALDARSLFVPIVTPGVRFLDDKLFLGLGLGFSGFSTDNPDTSRSGWSLSPLATYDLISDQYAAFYLAGWFNLAHLGETETCNAGGVCVTANNDVTGWGLNIGAGVRGLLSRGLALGGEFGWGFLDLSADNDPDAFVHGLFGNIFLEASVGL